MKKQNLLFAFLFLFSVTGAQAQDHCCLLTNNQEVTKLSEGSKQVPDDKMQAILQEEIKRFTDYAANEFEYPEQVKDHCIEGEMIVRVVYNKGFESIEIVKSIDPFLDKMVLKNISTYVKNFDRNYENAPRLVFKLPINFRMEG
ncbi:MAG: hypothetical protein ACI8YQ_001998 [Polaribacter sp.]|jgi:hypothetical protein